MEKNRIILIGFCNLRFNEAGGISGFFNNFIYPLIFNSLHF